MLTVIRSIGNNHGHVGTWCWAQSSRTGKVCNFESSSSSESVFLVITGYWDASILWDETAIKMCIALKTQDN